MERCHLRCCLEGNENNTGVQNIRRNRGITDGAHQGTVLLSQLSVVSGCLDPFRTIAKKISKNVCRVGTRGRIGGTHGTRRAGRRGWPPGSLGKGNCRARSWRLQTGVTGRETASEGVWLSTVSVGTSLHNEVSFSRHGRGHLLAGKTEGGGAVFTLCLWEGGCGNISEGPGRQPCGRGRRRGKAPVRGS